MRATSAAGAGAASNAATATTEAPPPPLTASVSQAPGEHDGGEFAVRVRFSEDVETKAKAARFQVDGGSAKARRWRERRDLWQVKLRPDLYAAVTLTLPGAHLSDGEATGTIENTDLMPAALLARFGAGDGRAGRAHRGANGGGLVDGMEAVIHQTRTTEGVRHVEQRSASGDYDASEKPLGRRTGLATADSAIGECWSGAIAVEAVIAIGIAAATRGEANEMSRWPVPPTAERGPAAGLILWTLADHRRFELIACCTACERYVVLEHAALARMTEREGSDPEVQAPIRVEKGRSSTRRIGELFRTGRPGPTTSGSPSGSSRR